MKIQSKVKPLVSSLLARLRRVKLSRRNLLLIVIASIIFVLVIVLFVLSVVSDRDIAACSSSRQKTSEQLKTKIHLDELRNFEKDLQAIDSKCTDKSPLDSNSKEDKMVQLNYFFTLSSTQYRLDERDKASKNADEGLKIYEKLPDSEKQSSEVKDIVVRLKAIKEGNY